MPSRLQFARTILLTATLLATPAIATAQALTPAEATAIDTLVTTTLAKTGPPSASIAVVRGGRIILAKAYGKQSETASSARADAPYQIASVSKQFTAAALQLLEDDGKLSLDDTVAKYLPGITRGETIKLRQLLSHTAGLQDYWPQDYSFKAMGTPVEPQGIVDRWAKKPLDFAPGTQWQYSNTGYVVAGMIVEKVAGEPLLAFLQRRIFAPLGMTAVDQDIAIGGRYPTGYGRAALGPMRPVVPAAHGWLFAAGELAMSATDLAKWNIARMNRAVLPSDDWAAQETPVKLTDGTSTGYGLGVSIGHVGDRRVVSHTGEAVGFLTQNIVYPDDKVAIVVLTNTWSSDAYRAIASGIAKTVLPVQPATAADTRALAGARALLDQLIAGRPDRTRLTDNAAYYFTPATIADYRTSLAPLGRPTDFVQTGASTLRGGFVGRGYRVSFGNRAIAISTFTEPGINGRIEQFLISPAD